MRRQEGYIFRKGFAWFGRWREDTLKDGRVVRRHRCRKLADVSERYRTKRDVRPLLDEIVLPVNAGRVRAVSTQTVAEFVERFFLPHADADLKPSTAHGYRELWKLYLADRLRRVVLRDFRCADATALLAEIHREHGVGRSTLLNCKRRLSAIFAYAKQVGALDGVNPVQDAAIPRTAQPPKPTHAVTPEEVMRMLDTLTGEARLAVALMFFCALRPGEARGVRWEDYDGKRLHVRRSVWRTTVGGPKTEGSSAAVPVCETLRKVLAESRNGFNRGGYILSTPSGKPIDLHNLANRTVIPTLRKAGIKWHGWRALRTGAATLAASVESPVAAKSLLRHSNVATTQRHYVKDVPEEAMRVAEKFDALFERATGERVQ